MKKYKITQKIGAGGMGEVYRARDNVNGTDVAIKILPAQLSHNEEVKKRFLREMVTCSKLDHPQVIRVYDYGQMKDTLYYVMEYIKGKSVAEMIDADGAVPLVTALDIARQILEALDYIHSNNLIHRDLKPSNILIEKKGGTAVRAVLMDFGLVKAFDSQLTRTGRVLGTPRYIAPEMLSQGQVDHRSDVFQLGVILYEMVTGDYAFKGTTRAEVARNCLTKEPEAPSLLNPDVDVNLDNLIFNAMEKDPDQRYASATEMLADLEALKKGTKIYRRHLRRRTREHTVAIPVIETVAADDPSLVTYLEEGNEGRVNPNWFLWALIPLLMVPFLIYGLFGGERIYTVRDVRIEEGVDRATIRWRSEEPYQTVVQFGTSKRSMSIVETDSEPKKQHEVVLAPLKEDTSYVMQVVFPQRKRSADYTFKTKRFELTDVAWTYNRLGKLDLSWKTNVPSKGRVRYGHDADMRTVREEDFAVIHRHLVEVGDPTKDSSFVIISQTQDGKERSSQRHIVPSPFTLGRELNQQLGSLDVRQLVTAMATAPEPRSFADDRLAEPSFRKAYRAFVPIAGIFFGHERIPTTWKTQLYHRLSELFAVDGMLCSHGLEPITRVQTLLRGDFSIADVTTLKEYVVETVPMSIPEMEGLTYSPGKQHSIEFRARGLRQDVEYPLLLLNAARFSAAEVRLAVEGFTHQLRLDLTINGKVTLAFYNIRPGSGGTVDRAHRFPVDVLREGTNVFKLSIATLSGKASPAIVKVRSVVLAFVPR